MCVCVCLCVCVVQVFFEDVKALNVLSEGEVSGWGIENTVCTV